MYSHINYHSPCNKECHINPDTNLCRGCFRTIDEIIRWPYINEEEKAKINRRIESRQKNILDHKSS